MIRDIIARALTRRHGRAPEALPRVLDGDPWGDKAAAVELPPRARATFPRLSMDVPTWLDRLDGITALHSNWECDELSEIILRCHALITITLTGEGASKHLARAARLACIAEAEYRAYMRVAPTVSSGQHVEIEKQVGTPEDPYTQRVIAFLRTYVWAMDAIRATAQWTGDADTLARIARASVVELVACLELPSESVIF